MKIACQMIRPHHPDCTCSVCDAWQDEKCGKSSIGTHAESVRVCADCAHKMESEGFAIAYDVTPCPCEPSLLRHSKMDHDELRKLAHGRCPICDPSVSRQEYGEIVQRVLRDPALRKTVIKS